MADDRSVRGAQRAVSRPESPCLAGSSVATAIGCQHAEAPGRCRPRRGIARSVGFAVRAAAATLCVTVLALAVTPAQAQTVTIEKISGEESFDSAERATSKFRIRARGSDAPWQGANEHAGITVGVKFDYEGRDLEYWSNSNYTRAPGKKVSSFEVVLARSWQAVGSVPGNRFWDLTEHDMGNHDLHLIGPVIVRLYDPPGGRTYSLGSDTAICLVINESDGTAGEPCSSSQRRSVQVRERLTASFDGLPDSHDGQTAFSFRIQFSEDIDATVDGMRDHALNVSGGTVTGAARVNKRDDLWSFTITPSGDGMVEIALAGGASCTADGAICTSDGRQLSTGLLTIVSGPMPTLSVADVQAYEGVDDHMTFYVSMDRAATERSWVKYATADGTAEAGSDYTAKSGELHFFPGEKVRWMIQVPIIDDTVEDDGETFTLTLSDPKGVTIGDGVATGTIRNSEEPVEVSVADAEATEGEDRWMRFRLSLNHIAKDVSVDYATADGTATAGVDYVARSGSVVLRKGTINTEITVPILSDSVEDDGERFTLTLSNVSGAAVADGAAIGTIRDGEPEPGSTVSTASTASTGPLWSADMSVVDFGNGSIGAWGTGKFSNVGGTGNLKAKWLWYHTGDRKLHLAFTTAIADTTGLSLYMGDAALAFPDGGNDSSFSWTDFDIAWADGETVPVRIAKSGPVVVTPANAPPTGLPAITGTPQVGEVLTASVSDVEDGDGLENATFAYQWLANDGTDDSEIAGATGSTHEVAPAEVDKTLKVRVTFTDDKGTEETLTSVATEAVAARAPDAPGGLAAETTEGREGELDVSWTVPASDGGSAVTGYRVQWKSGTEAYDGSEASARQAVLGDPTAANHTITGLTVGTAYTVRVLAVNAAGAGAAAEVEATVRDRVAPVLASASVNGTALTLTFSEALDATSQPGADAFAVTVDDNARGVDAVALSESAVALTLASAVAADETVTVGYAAPAGADAAPLEDAVGNAAASFTGESVSNDTPAAENTDPAGLPEISGTAEVGETLTASADAIEDEDGLENATFAYQWLANDGTDDSEIAGATGATHEVGAEDAGKTLTVRVTFTDDKGNEETLTSAATDTAVDRRPVAATLSVGAGAAEAGRFRLRIAFGDAVTGLALTDLSAARVAGAAAAVTELAEAETGRAWTAWVAAEAGRYTVRLAAGAAEAGERRSLASVLAVDVDADGNATAVSGPVVTSVALEAAPDGTWTAGETVRLSLTFSEPVTVATDGGTPTVGIGLDGTARRAAHAGGTGTLAVFSYRLTADDGTVSAVTVTADSLALNGGTIRDRAGRDADLEHPGIGEAADETKTESASALTGLMLVDTGSGTETALADDDALVLADPANGSWGLAASVAPGAGVGSVVLALTGAKTVTVTDNATPYSLYGDADGTVTGAGLPAGSYTLTATAYAEAAGAGAELGTLSVSFTVAASEAVAPDALTASFEGVPEVHDGSSPFTFRVRFSQEPRVSYKVLRDESFAVTGGEVRKARRVDGRNDLREIHIEPKGWDDVTVMLAGGRACGTEGAICTADGKVLANTAVATVPGPLALSVADARVDEAAGAVLAFEVTLNRAASGTVTVDYATADGTATAGADYTATSGTLTFDPGETAKTVNVPVLDDAHDDTGETLTLTLSNAAGARIWDGEATGTIENSDPIPEAWLARFGRTVADHVVDAVAERLEGPSGGGSQVTLGGQRIPLDGVPGGAGSDTPETAAAADTLAAFADRMSGASTERGTAWTRRVDGGGEDGAKRRESRGLTERELLLGSSFVLALGGAEANGTGTAWTAWGRAASSRFDGEADGLSLDGDVTTFTFGADAARGRWLGGVALAHSTGEGGYRDHDDTGDPNNRGQGTGTLESSLTSVHPYLRFQASERLSLWGILGYGTGDLTLAVDAAGDRPRQTWKTGTEMWMAAAGARGVLLSAAEHDGFELAARGDARLVRMNSDAATGADGSGKLAASESQTSRLRFVLEGSQRIELAGGQALTPSLEVGLRHDGGDAETGTGVEVGAGVSYADPALGLTVTAKARGLVAHDDADYTEWGASGSVMIDPGAAGRGLSLSLSPAWGAESGGAERLWSARDARGLAGNDALEPAGRLDAEAGYGLGAFGGRGVMTPFAGLSLSDAGERTWRSGVRWTLGPDTAFGVEGTLREAANDNAGEHGIGFRLTARW